MKVILDMKSDLDSVRLGGFVWNKVDGKFETFLSDAQYKEVKAGYGDIVNAVVVKKKRARKAK